MPMRSPYVIQLTKGEQAELLARSREYTSAYRDVVRAKIVLLASQGLGNASIAEHLDTPRQIVSKWRRRFHDERLAGLDELPRSGRPARFSPQYRCRDQACPCGGGGRWLVSCRHAGVCRWPAGQCPNCAGKRCRAASSRKSAAPLYGAGSARMHCADGGIAPGSSHAIGNSPAKPAVFSISTRAGGVATHWGRVIMCSPPTRRPVSRPDGANINHWLPLPGVRSVSSTNMREPARWLISPPGMCIVPGCSGVASARLASPRSSVLSRRSWARSRIGPRAMCSLSPTMAPPTVGGGRLTASEPNGPMSFWFIRQSTPAG